MEKNCVKVAFNGNFKKLTIKFCHIELNYQIDECDHADEYHDETCAKIELLFRLGEERYAIGYGERYIEVLNNRIEEETDNDIVAEIKEKKSDFLKLFSTLTTNKDKRKE